MRFAERKIRNFLRNEDFEDGAVVNAQQNTPELNGHHLYKTYTTLELRSQPIDLIDKNHRSLSS